MKDVYTMKMHTMTTLVRDGDTGEINILRVPGGWIYTSIIFDEHTSVFVPWCESDEPPEKSGNLDEIRARLMKAEVALGKIQFEITDEEITPHEAQSMLENVELIINKHYGNE